MTQQKYSDSEARGALLAAARLLVADNADFTVKTLLTGTGISRSQFRRCFAGKTQLLAALTSQDIHVLGEILDAAQPAQMAHAIGSDVAPSPSRPPATDAWLERRLRVFERALSGLEKRQEKSEQELAQRLAVIAEKLDGFAAGPLSQPEPAPLPVDPLPAEPLLNEMVVATPVPTVMARIAEIADFEPAPAAEKPLAEKPVSETEIAEFIAEARRIARNAHLATPSPPEYQTRWLAWSGVALIFALACAGILFASGALGHADSALPVQAASGTAYRHVAKNGVARVIALADNGDATAQTALALAYLRGQGVGSDDDAARRWSRAAAAQGQPVAQYLLGTLYLQHDDSEAARWFKAAALQGNVKAMHNLAIAYAEGLGVEKDPAQAVQWFARAAQQGYRDSQFDLAVLYERGMGVPQTARIALKWYLIAAAHGDKPSAQRAQFLRGQMDPLEAKSATAQAASFVPLAATGFANELPAI